MTRLDSKEEFALQVKTRRAQFGKTKKKLSLRLPAWLYPSAVERWYASVLISHVVDLGRIIKSDLIPNIQSLIDERNLSIGLDSSRSDALGKEFKRLYEALVISFAQSKFNSEDISTQTAQKVNSWNSKQWKKQARTALGVDIFTREPFVDYTLSEFVQSNVSLIKKMTDELLTSTETIVQNGLRQGKHSSAIAKDLMNKIDLSKKRAKLIARDQVGKFNGQLTEMRQKNAGIDRYIWRDSDDSRVRPEHSSRDGSVFSWSEPPSDGHPGQPIQCRCYAEPVWDSVFKTLGVEQ